MPAPYSTDDKARFRCTKPVLVWPVHATVTAKQIADFGGDLAALVADGSLEPRGPEHA
jgi:hypothetical protein